MNNRNLCPFLLLSLIAVIVLSGAISLAAQDTDRPWMNPNLPPEERADLVLKRMTLDEKLALLHGNGMANNPKWTMRLTPLTNGGGSCGSN